MAPYESSISAGFIFLQELTGFLDKLSPAFIELIQSNLALHKSIKEQRIMDRRIRKCKRICRRNKLSNILIVEQVELDFSDLSIDQQNKITNLLSFELLNN